MRDGSRTENLEPALGIRIRQTGTDAHETVEDHPGEFTHARLADRNQRAVESARTDGDVIADASRGEEFFDFLDWRGEVGVGE